MEHDNRICPRCGESAGDHGFCDSCRSHIESLTGIPTRAVTYASDATSPTTQVLHQVMQLEEALAAVSKGISERIAAGPSASVEVDADPRAAKQAPADVSERVRLPHTADERGTDTTPPRDVARLEDVLKVSPPAHPVASVPPPAVPELEGARRQAYEVDAEPAPEAVSVPPPSSVPSYVAAQALREAFWFEQTVAFNNTTAGRQEPAATPEIAPAPVHIERHVEPAPCEPATGSSDWVTALFVLTLVALVMLLTGRRPRR